VLTLFACLQVKDVATVLGLNTCQDTYVGNAMTVLCWHYQLYCLLPPYVCLMNHMCLCLCFSLLLSSSLSLAGEVKVMDAISNGLDAATTFDIIRSLKTFVSIIESTVVVSLLQPAPEVFQLFDDLILLSQGQIIYHGPVESVLEYFEGLGYSCPDHVDVADFLQEIPMPEGRKYLAAPPSSSSSSSEAVVETSSKEVVGGGRRSEASSRAVGTTQLAAAWSASRLCKDMQADMETLLAEPKLSWLDHHTEKYASSFLFYVNLLLEREVTVLKRDLSFIKSRIAQAILVGGIVSTLFTNLQPNDAQTMGGFLFFAVLQCGLGGMALLPTVFAQKAVYYKQFRASFFPAPSFVLAQSFVLLPLQIIEAILFGLITYFSVGMSEDDGGGRFFAFVLTIFMFGICVSQIFRLIACLTPEPTAAQPMCGVYLVVMVLFSGYIIPKNGISDGWIWFYWINPLAYALKGITVNEFLGSEYDELICANYPACTQFVRFGDSVLEGRGNPSDQAAVWYGILFLFGTYVLMLILTTLALMFVVTEPHPVPPAYEDFGETTAVVGPSSAESTPVSAGKEEDIINAETYGDENAEALQSAPIIPFEPVSFSFKDIWYTVKLKGGEELDLLRGVDGCFEPGTVTALMGSSGAGM
jgi:ABC-type multidrug transport system ATPase subunit/ABC-type multidrug transport system permease subunit